MAPYIEIIIFAICCAAIGVLALVIPFRYSPFRLAHLLGPLVDDDLKYKTPRLVGYFMLACSLIFAAAGGGLYAIDAFRKIEYRREAHARLLAISRFEKSLIGEIKSAMHRANRVDVYTLRSSGRGFNLLARNVKGAPVKQLVDILDRIVLPHRDFDKSEARFGEPSCLIYLKSDHKTLLKFGFQDKDASYLCQMKNIPPFENMFSIEQLKLLQDWRAKLQKDASK